MTEQGYIGNNEGNMYGNQDGWIHIERLIWAVIEEKASVCREPIGIRENQDQD
jgi:hypothetical protein